MSALPLTSMVPQIPLVYIASNGHSGSTLLDLLLGANQAIWTTGEAQNLPWEVRNQRAPCGCGKPVHEDEFWQSVTEELSLSIEGYHIGYFRNIAQVGKVIRWKLIPDILRNEVSDERRPAVQEYGKNNFDYFQAVKREAEKRTESQVKWLVDNSKDPYRLHWLQHSGLFKIRAIHLVKDPRAFVYSMVKRQSSPSLNHVLRYTIRWIIENAIISRVVSRSIFDENVRVIKYERLALHPEEVLGELSEWLEISYNPQSIHTFREYENHALSGNMMRWRRSEARIRLDEKWKTELPEWAKALVRSLTKPFNHICGYEN